METRAGKIDRALRHYMIAAEDGCSDSLDVIQDLYSKGHARKEYYTKALQYQEYLSEIKSRQREEAAATCENCCYY